MAKHIISFIMGITLLTVGIILGLLNIAEYKTVDIPVLDTIDLAELVSFYDEKSTFYTIYLPKYSSYKVVLDDDAKEVYVVVHYNEEVLEVFINEKDTTNKGKEIFIESQYKRKVVGGSKSLFMALKKTIQNKTIYNYNYLFEPEIEIHVNSINKDKIEIIKDGVLLKHRYE